MLSALAIIGLCAISIEAIFTNGEFETVLSTFVRMEALEKYVEATKPPDSATAFVIKAKTSSQVKQVFIKNSEKLFWFFWFLITDDDDLNPEIRIPYNCQLFQIKTVSNGTYRLVERYHIKNRTDYEGEFGFWKRGNGLTTSSSHIYSRRTDMKGVQLNITVCKRYKTENIIQTFWIDLSRVLNFTLITEPQILKKTPNGYVPLQNPDGSTCIWGITGLDFEKDWIFSTSGVKVKLVMKFRGTNEVGWRAYVQPFTREMWLALSVWLLVSSAAVIIVNGCTTEALYLYFFTAFFCLCNSDPTAVYPPNEPFPTRAKLVYLTVVAVPAVIIPAYSAYILSTLSVIRPLEPFNNLRDFIKDSTYRLTVVNNTFAIRYLRGSRDPEIKYIYDNLFVGADYAPPTFSALFEQLCETNKLVGLYVDLKMFRRLFRCRMFIAQQEMITMSTGVLLSKGSPLRKMLNERFSKYFESGLMKRALEETSESPQQKEEGGLNALNMSQMGVIFFLVPLGVALSLAVLAVECFVKRRWQRTSNAVSFNPGGLECHANRPPDYFFMRRV